GPELTREHVERVALVAVADVADEPRVVLRLVPVPAAEEAEVRLRLARGGTEAALVVVADQEVERHREAESHRPEIELGVDHRRGVGALALDVVDRQADVRARSAPEEQGRIRERLSVRGGCIRLALAGAGLVLGRRRGGEEQGRPENAQSHFPLPVSRRKSTVPNVSRRSEKSDAPATRR